MSVATTSVSITPRSRRTSSAMSMSSRRARAAAQRRRLDVEARAMHVRREPERRLVGVAEERGAVGARELEARARAPRRVELRLVHHLLLVAVRRGDLHQVVDDAHGGRFVGACLSGISAVTDQ